MMLLTCILCTYIHDLVSWYQLKPLLTHTHEEEEEGFAQTTISIVWELIPYMVL